MDYRYETKDSARDFHKQRKSFIILNNNVYFLPEGSSMSHFEYCKKIGLDKEIFNQITRGYYLNGNLVFYKDNFTYDEDLINESLNFIDEISDELKVDEFEIYFGHLPEDNFKLDYHYGSYEEGEILKNKQK